MIKRNIRLIAILTGVSLLLLTPLVAMQFTDEVNWTLGDFVVAAVLLYGTGFTCEIIFRKVTNPRRRIALCLAILALLFLVWVELAVGLFGTPFAGS